MRYVLTLLPFLLAGVSWAQPRPQMSWSGYVMGGATLFIQGNKTDVQGRTTGAIDRPQAKFNAGLPAAMQQIRMEVRKGTHVEIAEQPTAENDYSAVIQMVPGSARPEFYQLDFFWDTQVNPGPGRTRTVEGPGQLRWSGSVDEEVVVEVKGKQASSKVVRGQSVTEETLDIRGPLPAQDVTVRLANVNGRGMVDIAEQPSAANGYVAKVRIADKEKGRAPYSFQLTWQQPGGGKASAPNADFSKLMAGHTATWSGRVEGKTQVTLKGRNATVTTVSGKPVSGMNAEFSDAIPSQPARGVTLRKLQGRGEVKLVEQPPNSGSVVFEIDDNKGGDDFYKVEITWQ